MRQPPLQGPLFWQYYLSFWLCGIGAALWLWPALCTAGLLLLLARPLRQGFPRHPLPLLCALLLFCAGLGLAGGQLRPPAPADLPQWYNTALDHKTARRDFPRLCGQVDSVLGLPDGRLRILLQKVAPATADSARTGPTATGGTTEAHTAPKPGPPALPGLLVWTWDKALFHPLPGQTVCLSRQARPVHGLTNAGVAPWEQYWTARGVYWRTWSRGDTGEPVLSGQPARSALWREALRQDFLQALWPALFQETTEQDPLRGYKELPTEPQPDRGSFHSPLPEEPALPQSGAILLALLFGDRQYLSQETTELFAHATLAHSLALSGQHLAIAGLLGLACVVLAVRFRPGLYLCCPRALLVLLVSLPLALAYLWLGNAPASLLRAVCMLCIVALWLLQKRCSTTWDVLCAALVCITSVWPLSVFDTGLQLSALCVGIIGICLPWLRHILPTQRTQGRSAHFWRLLRALLSIFCISLSIQLGLLPLNLLLFGNAGFWFILNVLWLPVVSLLVLPGAVLGLLCTLLHWQDGASVILSLAALPCDALLWLLHWLDTAGILQNPLFLRPHWTALLAFAVLMAGWGLLAGSMSALRARASRHLLLTGLLLLCVGPLLRSGERLSSAVEVNVLDVGQGLAVSLRGPDHLRLLIDGGGSLSTRFDPGKAVVGPQLSYNDAPRLDAVLNSHPDLDHLGGLIYITEHFQPTALLHNGQEPRGRLRPVWKQICSTQHGQTLYAGDILQLGDPKLGLKLEVLHPPRPQAGQKALSGNDASLILRLTRHGEGLFLFTGDAERKALRQLLKSGKDLRAAVVLVPHHGAAGSFLADFYRAARPQAVVVSCGFMNRFRHPAARIRSWLADEGIPLLSTAEMGQIGLRWPAQGALEIETARAGRIALQVPAPASRESAPALHMARP